MFFKDKIGVAYVLDDSIDSGEYILDLYIVYLDKSQYEFKLYKKISNFSLEPLYNLIDEVEAKPIDYYKSQDFGKGLKS